MDELERPLHAVQDVIDWVIDRPALFDGPRWLDELRSIESEMQLEIDAAEQSAAAD